MSELISVNVGVSREIALADRTVSTAFWKSPVTGRVPATRNGLAGDQQADPRVHGGPNKAVYAYAFEDTTWWAQALDRPLGPGAFGENLTTAGIDLTNSRIGDTWSVGTAVLEVVGPRMPCYKIGIRFGDPGMTRRFAAANRPGAYLRVLLGGDLTAGDGIEVLTRPMHGVTVGLVSRAFVDHDPDLAAEMLRAPELPADWRAWAMRAKDRRAVV